LRERQPALEHEDQIDDHRHRQVGGQHVEGVGLPVHRLAAGLSPNQEIEGVVHRVEDRVQPGLAIGDDVGEIAADRDAEQQDDQQYEDDLQPGLHRGLPASKPLRMNDRIKQIGDQQHQQHHQQIKGHRLLLVPGLLALAPNDVLGKAHEPTAESEEANQQEQHQQVEEHRSNLFGCSGRRLDPPQSPQKARLPPRVAIPEKPQRLEAPARRDSPLSRAPAAAILRTR
jgi:hypothetical protein